MPPPCQEDNPPQTGPKMSIGKTGEGRHITVNGIRLTDIQKNRKFGNKEHTSTNKKKKRNNKPTLSVDQNGGILKYVIRNKKGRHQYFNDS